ncbi:SKP1-like protein 14 [Mercurialis annua]|uniref:SKP1-like protein 14 n=1 Tax=Mercurialis annua TaxID=3986 RepID=UPI00215F7C39|nr:SKP1-like protein 14 [Mercurialis annua]
MQMALAVLRSIMQNSDKNVFLCFDFPFNANILRIIPKFLVTNFHMSSPTVNQNLDALYAASAAPPPAISGKKITLKTEENSLVEVEEEVAMEFAIVKDLFTAEEEGKSSTGTVVPLPKVSAKTLSPIIAYCRKHLEMRKLKQDKNKDMKEKCDKAFVKHLNNEDLKEILLAVNYLEIKYLFDALNTAIAERISNKSVEYARRFFGIECDYTPQELHRLRNETSWAYERLDSDDDDFVF